MNILLFSALLLLIILLVKYFVGSKRNSGLKILVGFGILIGLLTLGLNSISDEAFGASTPVNVRAENLTDKKLKIYTIAFWNNNWNVNGNYVTYDKELKPNEKSDFWFENDGTTEFWLVAKNKNGGIDYLNVIKEQKGEFDFEIIQSKDIDLNNVQIAKELTLRIDKKLKMEKYLVWTNIILIGLLILSLVKIKTGGNTV
jgi:hypothetical protein